MTHEIQAQMECKEDAELAAGLRTIKEQAEEILRLLQRQEGEVRPSLSVVLGGKEQ